MEKLQPPVEPLRHTWVRPGGPYYKGQWIWDTMFVVDLLSLLPNRKKVIRDIFQKVVNHGDSPQHFVAYDDNGNVMGLVDDSNGTISARYEYGPFGEPLRATGPLAFVNPLYVGQWPSPFTVKLIGASGR